MNHHFTRIGDKPRVKALVTACKKAGHAITQKGEAFVYYYEAKAEDGSMVFKAVNMGRVWAITYYAPHFEDTPITEPATPVGFKQRITTHP